MGPGSGGFGIPLGRGGDCWANKDVTTQPAKATATHIRRNVDMRFSIRVDYTICFLARSTSSTTGKRCLQPDWGKHDVGEFGYPDANACPPSPESKRSGDAWQAMTGDEQEP